MSRGRAVFLDRDGVINRKPPEGSYVTRWEDMKFLPGVKEGIALLNQAGFKVIVVTNQRCVAKGLLTGGELYALHQRMCEIFASSGAIIDDIYSCPHDIHPPCNCRKPRPGMLLEAAGSHNLDLSASWMIGDSETDMEAGRVAGCKTARLLASGQPANGNADVVAPSLLEAIHQILG